MTGWVEGTTAKVRLRILSNDVIELLDAWDRYVGTKDEEGFDCVDEVAAAVGNLRQRMADWESHAPRRLG